MKIYIKNTIFLSLIFSFVFYLYRENILLFYPAVSLAQEVSSGVSNIKIINDRWPDFSTSKNFGQSASKIMMAATEEEKALAVYRFIQQSTMVIGPVPQEPVYGISDVVYPEKLLNVYGAHYCDGLTRIMAEVWRAMGNRAEKTYFFGHTVADIYYQDTDGQSRWHSFDNSANHWFLWDRTGGHIATPEELITDASLIYRPAFPITKYPGAPAPPVPSYIHSSHLRPLDYNRLYDLRNGESVTLYWGNVGKPYYIPTGNDVGGIDFEHGPYEKTYGNAEWVYQPDFSTDNWTDGVEGNPINLSTGISPRLHPTNVGSISSVVYRFSFPYIISDTVLSGTFHRSAFDVLKVSVSADGISWTEKWNSSDTGTFSLSDIPLSTNTYPPAAGSVPFGRYDYYLKIEMIAANNSSDVGIDTLNIKNVTQHNIFSLPQLWPVDNQITVEGSVANDTTLRVTYIWDDLQGINRQNIVELESLPYSYEIKADGVAWSDVKSKSLKIEAIPRLGGGNRVETKETAPGHTEDRLPNDEFNVTAIVEQGGWAPGSLKTTAQYIIDIQTGLSNDNFSLIHQALFGLMVRKDPAAKQAILDVIYNTKSYKYQTRNYALQALYLTVGEESAAVMVDVLERDAAIGWVDTTGEFDVDSVWIWNCQMAAFILSRINNLESRNNVSLIEDLADSGTLQTKLGGRAPTEIYRWSEIRWGFIKAIGILGGAGQVEFLRGEITSTWTGDNAPEAARALGKIGIKDPVTGSALKTLISNAEKQSSSRMKILYSIEALGKVGSQSDASSLYKYLYDWDEDLRGYASIALGQLGNKEAIPQLQALLETESFPWVRQAAENSISALLGGSVDIVAPIAPNGLVVH